MAQGRGNAGATAEAATGDAGANGAGAANSGKVRPDRSYIVVPVPPDLKARFENEAKEKDLPVGPYVRNLLANFLGIEIPVTVTSRRSKYANDDERKAAQKARNANRSSTMRDLMAAFREAQKSGKSPEEAAQLASQKIAQLLANGPSQKPEGDASDAATAQTEAQPATA